MSTLFSIIGPTATGKTKLSLALSEKFLREKKFAGVELISVDSRQVYKGLEIISGADIPKNFKLIKKFKPYPYPYFQHENLNINLHGIKIIEPAQEWSLGHFQQFAQKIIKTAQEKKHLVILVGGTGLYHNRLFEIDPQLRVPPNKKLRISLEKLSLMALQEKLKKINIKKFESLNNSDKNNPRRLIRAIEISMAGNKKQEILNKFQDDKVVRKIIGLIAPPDFLAQKIKKRVATRFNSGAIAEVKTLQNLIKARPNLPALSATGVGEINKYLLREVSAKECQQVWALREFQYAKRQLTWWKKQEQITWFTVTSNKFPQEILASEQLFSKLY